MADAAVPRGSAERKMAHYEENTFLGRDEMEVLRAKSLPDIQGGTLTSRSGMLDVPITLEPNEIRHIHLIPQKII